jgi:hypothetical protein
VIVEAAPLRDQVVDGDGASVVMIGYDVVVLSPLATYLVTLLRDGCRPLQDLTDGLVSAFGDPGGAGAAEELVHALVADLRSRGVVRVVTAT